MEIKEMNQKHKGIRLTMSQNSSRRGGARRQRAVLDDDDGASSVAGSVPGTQSSSVYNGGFDDPVRDEVIAELFGDERGDLDEDDEAGEDLFGDDMERDYRPQPELDVLSQSGIDDEENASEMSFGARRAAELEMEERDATNFGDRHLFYDAGDASQSQSDDHRRRRNRLRKRPEIIQEEEMEEDVPVDILENLRGRKVRDHVNDEAVAREIVRRFKRFLKNFKDPTTDKQKYILQIQQMASENRESLIIEYNDLADNAGEPAISFFLPEAPFEVIELFDLAATEVVSLMYPHYKRICATIHARIAGLPTFEEIRMLRHIHLNMLITTTGVVTVTSGILPRLSLVKYNCIACGYVIGPITQGSEDEVKPSSCASCQSRGPFELNVEETVYQNYQRITIQESPNLVEAGRLPRSKDVILTGDLCDACKPGDEIEVTGVFTNNYDSSLNSKQGFPVFAAVIVANYIRTKDQIESDALTDEDIKAIRELSKDPEIAKKIFASIAPTIYGHQDVKQAIALALFRGEPKTPNGKHSIRGDINVLLCGDPGTAKSQFLRYVGHLAPRSILTTGQGASAVGLTAYVQRHPVTREWTLEAGAMVLADKGVCLIDEFDKMNDQDRTSIHEAMEQQSISISKAGIVTSLRARCTVIAAANPIGGRYDSSRTFAENVDLTEPILSRFDILCVIRDQVDPVEDEHLADFVIKNHRKMHPNAIKESNESNNGSIDVFQENCPTTNVKLIPQQLLRKYLIYARENVHPKLEGRCAERIESVYSELRKESKATGSVAITLRHAEAMIRMAEAHAKMHLRGYVIEEDVNAAIRIMLECFIQTQKASIMRQMRKVFARQLTFKKDSSELLLYYLKQLVRDQLLYEQSRKNSSDVDGLDTVTISEDDLKAKARQLNMENLAPFYRSRFFTGNNFTYDPKQKKITQRLF
uniref:DNA replication licensing factor MCM2 n=1 Tax=Panagrolaimus sp. PS1159 TaxID=55785 RepID=A0AC35FGW3_9BILA